LLILILPFDCEWLCVADLRWLPWSLIWLEAISTTHLTKTDFFLYKQKISTEYKTSYQWEKIIPKM
jgi:hypothetical protein